MNFKLKKIIMIALEISLPILILLAILLILIFSFIILFIHPISYKKNFEKLETNYNFSILDSITVEKKELLFNYFASSSEWKVERMFYNSKLGREGINRSGYIMARKRKEREQSHFGGPLIIFDKIDDSYIKNYEFIKSEKNPLILTIVETKYLSLDDDKKTEKNLRNIILGNDLSMLIDLDMNSFQAIRDSLNLISNLKNIFNITQLIKKSASLEGLLSNLETQSYKYAHENELNIKQEGNYIKANGYVNTGKKGSVFLKIVNISTNEDVSHPGNYNEEFIGWSEIDSLKFYFELNDQHMIWGEEGDEFDADCQLWFRPYDETSNFIIKSENQNIKIGYRGF